jgi:SAM-dependent methyltransferase
MPYPLPVTSLDQSRGAYANPARRSALFHLLWPTEEPRSNQEILIAGCGTSQAARYALQMQDTRVTALDISETSLRCTHKLRQKYHLENLELHQMPIESVAGLGRSFDLVVCTGVLHHLPDPDVGLRALHDVLLPHGAMHLMVYARYGRMGVYMMQEYSRLLEIGTSDDELQGLAETLGALPAEHPVQVLLRRTKDMWQPAALADAFLHPQDRAYTVPELYDWLERCGMSFGRWYEQAPYLPQCGLLARTPHTARLSALPEPEQHAAAELLRGTITLHNLVAYRSDRPKERQPIRFTGEQWRSYVPIRFPWTRRVRDGVPRGSVAVLLNPTHRHTDLVLPIDAAQERLYDLIDGNRTLGEIVQNVKTRDDGLQALSFFRQLWQYDQIVFDASRPDRSA